MSSEAEKSAVRLEPSAEELLSLIFRYIARIPAERELDRLLVLFADLGREIVTASSCTLWLVDREKQVLWSKVSHQLGRVNIPLTAGIAGEVARTGKPILLNDPYRDPRFDPEIDRRYNFQTKNLIALPILSGGGEVMGVFQAVNKLTPEGVFNPKDMERFQLASTYTAMELEAAILHEEMETAEREIILTLAETGEMRSQETGQHVNRVAEYTALLAIECGLPADEVDRLKRAAPLHDIGKIAIPDAILLKPGPLSDGEMTIIRTHADLGYEILRHSDRRILKAAAIISSQHHEKWDGSGYPKKLSGEQIHLYGRIVALADVFDALGSDRCYKKAWPLEKILDYLREQSGKHFDPTLVKIFLGKLDSFIAVRDRNRD
jgi:HD-GYP domain-containing protein (c-di-GMP phosphodiesterase class II)